MDRRRQTGFAEGLSSVPPFGKGGLGGIHAKGPESESAPILPIAVPNSPPRPLGGEGRGEGVRSSRQGRQKNLGRGETPLTLTHSPQRGARGPESKPDRNGFRAKETESKTALILPKAVHNSPPRPLGGEGRGEGVRSNRQRRQGNLGRGETPLTLTLSPQRGARGPESKPALTFFAAALLLLTACAEPAPEAVTPSEPRPPIETRSKVDRAIATTGDVITYTVIVDYDPAYEVLVPEPGAEIAGFRIIDIGSEEPRDENGRRIEERYYQLRADLVGSYVLPPVEVSYRKLPPAESEETPEATATEADAPFETVQTSEIFIEVQSVLPEDGEATDIRGLKPLRQVETPTPWWWFAAGGGAALLLGLMAFLLWRRSRRHVEVPPRPAHEIAFEALERLRQTNFEDLEAMRLFHFEISEVLRAYVENRFRLNATDLTTEEITGRLDALHGLAADDNQRLRRFLVATDNVKFAAYEPGESEIEATYEDALSFVEATRERPEEATETPGANDEEQPKAVAA